ncbi:hypothetical protein MHYP_G00147080 [Metynnis hypsauchen]
MSACEFEQARSPSAVLQGAAQHTVLQLQRRQARRSSQHCSVILQQCGAGAEGEQTSVCDELRRKWQGSILSRLEISPGKLRVKLMTVIWSDWARPRTWDVQLRLRNSNLKREQRAGEEGIVTDESAQHPPWPRHHPEYWTIDTGTAALDTLLTTHINRRAHLSARPPFN